MYLFRFVFPALSYSSGFLFFLQTLSFADNTLYSTALLICLSFCPHSALTSIFRRQNGGGLQIKQDLIFKTMFGERNYL